MQSTKNLGKTRKKHKYIFVIGGVMSGVGKGITTSSIGTILQAKGLKVNIVKVDPYLNVDAGTMNPTEHGEVFVLNSGLETDQDMGNYERFLNRDIDSCDYMTSGMIYKFVIDKERSLGFRGKCVDADNIRDEIISRIEGSAETAKSDISIIEIGGTVGDYQNIMFIEAARVIKVKHPDDVLFVMVSYMPIPGTLGEMKSKPTQNAIKQLNSYGVQTDIIIARSTVPIDAKRKEKIAITCNVPAENIISAPDIESVYDVPLNFERDKLGDMILKSLKMRVRPTNLTGWTSFVRKVKSAKKELNIAVVGKYFDTGDFVLSDAYVSVIEAIRFSSYAQGFKPKLHWLSAKQFEDKKAKEKNINGKKGKDKVESRGGQLVIDKLSRFDGIIVPGGFGETGIEGKINVIQYARENKIPYFGLCYGMQLMVIEYARNVLGLADATTSEIRPNSKDLLIDIMPEQREKLRQGNYGGSMRLGSYPAVLKRGSIARKAYGQDSITERHRHRYEVNPEYIEMIERAGLVFSGRSPDGTLMEIAELPQTANAFVGAGQIHPFFLGTQFHPEFKARPLSPHPLFSEFVKAAGNMQKNKKEINLHVEQKRKNEEVKQAKVVMKEFQLDNAIRKT